MPRNREVIKDGRNGRIISLSGNVVGSDDGKRSREQVSLSFASKVCASRDSQCL